MKAGSDRKTEQRKAMLEVIKEMRRKNQHLSADEMFVRIKNRLPATSLSTVYRNLENFTKQGLLVKLDSPGGPARYDAVTQPHQHIRCAACGRIDDLPYDTTSECNQAAIASIGYEFIACRMDYVGLCPNCRKNSTRKGA